MFLDDAIATLPTIEGLEPAEAVLYDIGGFAGHVAAHRWGVPAVQLSPASVAWEGFEDDMAEFYDALKASTSGSHYFATVRGWLDEHGVELDNDTFLGRPEACVVLIAKALQPNADRVSDRYTFAGPAIDESRNGLDAATRRRAARLHLLRHRVHRPRRPLHAVRHRTRRRPPGRDRHRQGRSGCAPGHGHQSPHDAPARRARTRRRVHHPRRHGRRQRGAVVRRPGGRGAAGRRPVRQRRHARSDRCGRATGGA